MTTRNLTANVFLCDADVTVNATTYDIDSAASRGDTSLTLTDASNFSSGDKCRTNKREDLEVTGVSGNTIKLKNGINFNYDTSDNVLLGEVEYTDTSHVVPIKTKQLERNAQADFNLYESNVSSGNMGQEEPRVEIQGNLKVKESYQITGQIFGDDFNSSSSYEDYLINKTFFPMVKLINEYGTVVKKGIIKKAKVTDKIEGVTKRENYEGITNPKDVKVKMVIAEFG